MSTVKVDCIQLTVMLLFCFMYQSLSFQKNSSSSSYQDITAWSLKLEFFLSSNIPPSYLSPRRVSLASSCQQLSYTSYWIYQTLPEKKCELRDLHKLHVVLLHQIFHVIFTSNLLVINANWLVLLYNPAIRMHHIPIIH